jgi:hypothetical protein
MISIQRPANLCMFHKTATCLSAHWVAIKVEILKVHVKGPRQLNKTVFVRILTYEAVCHLQSVSVVTDAATMMVGRKRRTSPQPP